MNIPKNKENSSIYKTNSSLENFVNIPKSKKSNSKRIETKTKYNQKQLWKDVRDSFYNLALHKNTNQFQEETNNFCNKYFSNLGVKA